MSKAAIIIFKYTSFGRVERFFEGLDSIYSNLEDTENFFVQCTFDFVDKESFNEQVISRLNQYKNISYYFGVSENKIDAINKNLDKLPMFDIIVNMSNDMVFTQHGFDNTIRDAMQSNFPDTDGVTHFPDTITGDRLITLSVFGKKYFDRFGYIYFKEYTSLYCDNEFGDVAKQLGKYVFIDKLIYIHKHPAFNLAPNDEQYKHTESFYGSDGEVYKKRKSINFGL